MPIFDYKCSDCDKTYEVYHKVREMAEDVDLPGLRFIKSQEVDVGSRHIVRGKIKRWFLVGLLLQTWR